MVEFLKWIKNKIKYYNIIRLIIIGDGLNYHQKIRQETDKTFKQRVKSGSKHYLVDPARFFIVPRNPIERIKDYFQRNKKQFMIIFYEGKKEALSLPSPSKVPSNILDLAERSNILRNALKEMFSTPISRRVIIFIIIIIVVAILFVSLYKEGRLVLPDWMG